MGGEGGILIGTCFGGQIEMGIEGSEHNVIWVSPYPQYHGLCI